MKSEAQINLERKAWARGKLTVACLKVSKAAEDPTLTAEQLEVYERELLDATAIAREWGIDPQLVVQEVERTG